MICRLTVLLLAISFISCNAPESKQVSPSTERDTDSTTDYSKLSDKEENAGKNMLPGNLGELISTIEIKIKATKEEEKIYEDSIVSWISLNKPEEAIKRLIDSEKIVIPYPSIILIIDYPLTNTAEFELTHENLGFTRKQLIQEVSKKYHAIYNEEEGTAKTKTVPVKQRERILNRNTTNGKYGIWGHDLSDLILSSIDVYKNKNGKIYVSLGIES